MSADPTRARDVFLAAAEVPDPAARAAFLDKACGEDVALRGRVEALLRAHDDPDSLLDAPVVAPFPPAPAAGAATRTEALPDEPTRTHGDGAADEDLADALSFLAPPGRSDSLGRLGHYEVLEVLGRGGFGIVYRAFDEVLQRVVAVKVLSPTMAATSPARKRFLREARSSAAVRHENVVQVHAVEEQPLPYLVMEFVPGETLQQRLDRTGPLDLPDILRIGRQVAEGLAAAHEKGLIHRDIKPANILLGGDPQEHVKITDFGLARAADDASLTRSGTVAGTPMYMAPEQAKGESLDHRADLFSLGSVLYVMCTGRPPFRAENTLAVLKRVAEDTPRPIREIIPEVPEWLCRIVGKLHAKDPAGRFQSAREVADVLADCEAQVKAHGALRDYSRIPGGRPAKRHRLRLAAAVCLPVALLAALAVTELTNLTHFFHTPHYWINLGVDDPNVTISIFHARTGDPEQDFADRAPEEPLPMMQYKGERRIRLPAGDYWFAAVRDDRILYAERIMIDRSRVVLIPWAAEVAKRDKPATGSEPGWVQLFNGKDLTGWKTHPDAPGKWEVKDGVLVGSGGDGYLFSKRDDYENFHLRAEVKINAGADSGVFFRSRLGPLVEGKRFKGHSPPGYEAQVCVDASAHRTGSLFLVQEGIEPALTREDRPLVLPDQWCTLEVIAEGPWLTVKVNGERTANVKNEAYSRGHLALQMWNDQTVVQFRKIEIKELPAGGSPAPADDYALAFDGKPSRVDIPSLSADGTHPLTVEFYCRPRAFSPKGDCILAMSGKGALFVSIGGDPPFLTSGAFLGDRASGQHFLLPDRMPERFHVAAVWDGREYRLFVDGRRVGRTYATGIRPNPARGTALGIDPSDPSKGRFDGVLDEVRVSKTARYDGDFTPAKRFESDKDTLALYHCNEGRGDRLTDSSGNGHHGIIVGARWVRADGSPVADKAGFVSLFNGKDLTGWKTHPDRPGGWSVEGGALVAKSGPGRHYLFTRRGDYADFVLRAECRISARGEGGLFFRCEHGFGRSRWGGQWTEPQGYEIGINQGSRDFQTGSLYGPDDKPPALRWVMDEDTPADQWFPIEVEARGNRITVRVRGRKLYEYTDARRLYRGGHIALEAGAAGTTIRFRKVEIKELPPDPTGPAIDLMPLTKFELSGANVKRDASGVVVTPPNGKKGTVFVSSIPIATTLPREFVLEAAVERLAGDDGVTFNVPAFGTDFMFAADVFPRRGHYTGLSYIDGKDVSENGSGVRGKQLTDGKVHQIRITVRSSGVVAEIDGRVVAEHRGYEKLASKRRGPGGARFFMQVVGNPYRIHALRLVPLSEAPPPAVAPFDAKKGKELQGAWAQYLGVPVEHTDSVGMKLRLIPPGEFLMGTPPDQSAAVLKVARATGIMPIELGRIAAEGVQRPVRLTRPYYIGQFEVTSGQFKRFVDATGYRTELEVNGLGGWSNFQGKWTRRAPHVWRTPGEWKPGPDEPVVHITAADAEAFCAWLSKAEGVRYALPTDAQWEFACRAGTTGLTYAADGQTLADLAWTNELLGPLRTAPENHRPRHVGGKRANAFGLHDMLGNAWECLGENYAQGPTTAEPQIDPFTPPEKGQRVLRGGTWYRPGRIFARCATRMGGAADGQSDAGVGFRVVIAGDLKPLSAFAPDADGWVRLFNGKDLTGWTQARNASHPWKVEDGALVGRGECTLYSKRADYENFELRLEAKTNELAVGGPLFRLNPAMLPGAIFGYMVKFIGAPAGPAKTGDLWLTVPKKEIIARGATGTKPGEWFTMKIQARGPRIVVEVDGQVVLDFIQDDYTPRPGPLGLGIIAPGGVVHVRKIEIKELPPGGSPFGRRPGSAGEVRRFVGHEGPIRGVAFSADGQFALSCSGFPVGDRTIRMWEVATGKELRKFQGHNAQVHAAIFSPDGRRVLSAGQDHTVRLWDATTGEEIREFTGHTGTATILAFSADGRRAVSGSHDGTARIWEVDTGKELGRLVGHRNFIPGVAFSPDGRQIATAGWDGTARLWDAARCQELRKFEGHEAAVWQVAFLPGGDRIVTAGDDGTLRVWDAKTGRQVRQLLGHELQVFALSVARDGRHVLSGSGDGTVRLWEVDSGREVYRFRGNEDVVWTVALSPDGRYAICGGGGGLRDGAWANGRDWTVRLWRLPGDTSDLLPPFDARLGAKGLALGGLAVAAPTHELLPLPKLAADGPP